MERFPASPSTPFPVNVIRQVFVGVICGVMLHTGADVHAEETTWRLDYRRGPETPSNCPDESYLRTALGAKNGARDPFSNDASRTITIELVPTPEQIEARIQARNEQGKVVSESIAHAPLRRCDQLADRIVFLLREIIDPIALPEPVPTQNPAPSTPPPVPEKPPPTTEKPNVPSRPTQTPWKKISNRRLSLSLSLGASWWNAPHTAFTSVLGVGVQWPKYSIGIEGRYDKAWALPVTQSIVAEQLALGIVACGYHAFRATRFHVRGCLLGDVTGLSTKAQGARPIESASMAVNLGARGGAGVSLAPNWGIELYADGTIAIQQPRFVFDAQEDWQLPRFNGALRASLVGLFDML